MVSVSAWPTGLRIVSTATHHYPLIGIQAGRGGRGEPSPKPSHSTTVYTYCTYTELEPYRREGKGRRCCLGDRIIQFLAALAILHQEDLKNRINSSFFHFILVQLILFFLSHDAKQLARQGIE